MTWFEKIIPSRIKTERRTRSVPEGLWMKCPACDSVLYRPEVERNLQESNQLLESLLESIPAMIFAKDARDLKFVRINRTGERLLGVRREELIGKDDRDFFPPAQADHFVLLLPLQSGNTALAILVFLGGFSAATAMIVVDSLALSKMVTNDIVVPILLRTRVRDIYRASLRSMRLAILLVVFLGYVWAMMAGGHFLLVEMGLLSFVAVTQCAPATLLGLVWPRGNRRGAFAGISAGFALWFYTLIVPALVKEGFVPRTFLDQGPFGLALLRPTELFGLSGLDSVSHGVFWSLFANLGAYPRYRPTVTWSSCSANAATAW